MAKRKKTTTAEVRALDISVHDRRAKEIGRQAEVAAIDVPDPLALNPGDKITVLRQLRNDPLARLHSHHQIDEAQYRAGRAFQRDWEVAERGARAIDPTREAVDGGKIPEPITDRQAKARKRLVEMERVLGRNSHRVVCAVLVEGMSMVATSYFVFGRIGQRAEKNTGQLFRDALDVLAVEYGLANRR